MTAPNDLPVIDQLVVPVSGDVDDGVALAHAVQLAVRADLPVTVLRQVPGGASKRVPREEMELLAGRHSDADVRVQVIEAERPADAIVAYLEPRPGALVCMSTNSPTASRQLLFGSVAVEVARHGTAPLILLGPKAAMPEESSGIDQIVACLDGTAGAERALGVAQALAACLDLDFEICQVVAPLGPAGPQFECGYLASEAHHLESGRQIEWNVVHGETPAAGLIGFGHERPRAMLALGTHARRLGERFREGSVAVDVVSESRGPVLVVGPKCHMAAPEADAGG